MVMLSGDCGATKDGNFLAIMTFDYNDTAVSVILHEAPEIRIFDFKIL